MTPFGKQQEGLAVQAGARFARRGNGGLRQEKNYGSG